MRLTISTSLFLALTPLARLGPAASNALAIPAHMHDLFAAGSGPSPMSGFIIIPENSNNSDHKGAPSAGGGILDKAFERIAESWEEFLAKYLKFV